MASSNNYKVHSIKAVKNDPEAAALLQRIADQVEPVMQSRQWRVGTLQEFNPQNDSLLGLNVNRGQVIRLRLRHSKTSPTFMPFHSLLGTMAHELCHNVHGPHSTKFYALLDEVNAELETLLSKGIAGAGPFQTSGARLGGFARGSISAKEQMLKRAEDRARIGGLMSGATGNRLGGTAPANLEPRAAAALAAERRARDSTWCQADAGDTVEGDAGRERADAAAPAPKRPRMQIPRLIDIEKKVESAALPNRTTSTAMANKAIGSDVTEPWCCPQCTLLNVSEAVICGVCDAPRPPRGGEWSCGACTLQNPAERTLCDACGAQR